MTNKTKYGFIVIDGKIPILNVIEQLNAMRPKDEKFPEFDKTKENDSVYCVEWGMAKQRDHERAVYDKMINDLSETAESL